jgi:hypothetical protein
MKIHLFAILCIILLQLVFPAPFQLPVDTDDALQMLENGTLDSVTWQKIRPFYSIPLNVPSGDFLVLKRIFPEILKQLPSKQIISEKYSPWGEEQITRFFADFPQMIEFEPILDFTGNNASKGIMNFSISRTAIDGTGAVDAAFNLVPSPWLTIRGRSDVWDNHARWSDRFVFFKPTKSLSLQIGNIDWPDEYGLLSGRFSADSSNISGYNNWLYGNALSWNGFSFGYTPNNAYGDQRMYCFLYAHILNDNTQYALQAGLPFGECQGIDTYLVIDKYNKKENRTYGCVTYQYDTKKLDLNLAVGLTSQNHQAYPFLAMLKYAYTIGYLNVSLCHYNDTSGLQKSRKLHSDLGSVSETQLFTKITSIDLVNRLNFQKFPSACVQLSSALVDFQPAYTTIHCMLDKANEYYRWKVLAKVNLVSNHDKYSLGVTFSYTGFKPLDMTLDCCTQYSNNHLSPDRLKLAFSSAPLENVMIIPAFLLKPQYKDSSPEISGELWTVVAFRKGTTSQIRIKYPLKTDNNRKGFHFECKASFLL